MTRPQALPAAAYVWLLVVLMVSLIAVGCEEGPTQAAIPEDDLNKSSTQMSLTKQSTSNASNGKMTKGNSNKSRNRRSANSIVANDSCYQIQSGDCLSKIAKIYLGNANKYMEIFRLNQDILENPNKVYAGLRIKLPINGLQKYGKQTKTDVAVNDNKHINSDTLYEVQKGDCLSKIAKMRLGDAKRYIEIFDLNQDMLDNPDKIYVGQLLKLPGKQNREISCLKR